MIIDLKLKVWKFTLIETLEINSFSTSSIVLNINKVYFIVIFIKTLLPDRDSLKGVSVLGGVLESVIQKKKKKRQKGY